MNTLTKTFSDKLFNLGFRVAFWLFRRSPAKAAAPPADTQSWLTPPAGARSWQDALSAQPEQADPTNHR